MSTPTPTAAPFFHRVADANLPSSSLPRPPLTSSSSSSSSSLTFFAVGDMGWACDKTRAVAAAMNARATPPAGQSATTPIPSLILLLGDNFYPSGVSSSEDPLFDSVWGGVWMTDATPALRQTPWRVVLGNHDVDGSGPAQIAYTFHDRNRLKYNSMWQMVAENYYFSVATPGGGEQQPLSVDFFALDTNGCQGAVRRRFPHKQEELHAIVAELDMLLQQSTADFKVVYGHHPLHTKSIWHGKVSDCLREPFYDSSFNGSRETTPGYNLGAVLSRHGVDVYLSGHEHMLQYHEDGGVAFVVAGASGAEDVRLYGGENLRKHMMWAGLRRSDFGFVSVTVTSAGEMTITFIDAAGRVLFEKTKTKTLGAR